MGELVIARNPQAARDFHLIERIEAGIELKGSEVKSLRAHHADLKGSFGRVEKGEVRLHGLDIRPYPQAGWLAPEPQRVRRLLLHKGEIRRLEGRLLSGSMTLIPTKLYFKGSLVKVELALAKGKKLFDKREAIRRRETEREIARALKRRRENAS